MGTDLPREEKTRLFRLHDRARYEVIAEDQDVIGWNVIDVDGRQLGRIDELIVDPDEMKVRYLEIDLERELLEEGEEKHVLVPVGFAELDEQQNRVILHGLEETDLKRLPAYEGGPILRDFEVELRRILAPGSVERWGEEFYAHEHFNDSQFFQGGEAWTLSRPDSEIRPRFTAAEHSEAVWPKTLYSVRRLMGMVVRNARGEQVGRIADVLVDLERQQMAYAIVAGGGFWGMGEKFYVVPWKALHRRLHEEGVLFDVEAEKLKKAPRMTMDNLMDWTFGREIHRYYGITPYWEDERSPEQYH